MRILLLLLLVGCNETSVCGVRPGSEEQYQQYLGQCKPRHPVLIPQVPRVFCDQLAMTRGLIVCKKESTK